jgi:hypothetical protein
MEKLEREQSWREEEFDYVLQFLRTVLLKRMCSEHSLPDCHLVLNQVYRWSFTHLYNPISAKSITESNTLLAWYTFTIEKATFET